MKSTVPYIKKKVTKNHLHLKIHSIFHIHLTTVVQNTKDFVYKNWLVKCKSSQNLRKLKVISVQYKTYKNYFYLLSKHCYKGRTKFYLDNIVLI